MINPEPFNGALVTVSNYARKNMSFRHEIGLQIYN